MATTTTFEKYGVPISLSVQKAAQSKHKKRKGVAYPFVRVLSSTVTGGFIHSLTGQGSYVSSSAGKSLIRNNLRQLLLTQKGERVMLPDYGLDMNRFLFEPLDKTLFTLIKREVVLNISRYFPLARILSINVLSDELTADRSQLKIGLTIQLQDESLDIFDVEVSVR